MGFFLLATGRFAAGEEERKKKVSGSDRLVVPVLATPGGPPKTSRSLWLRVLAGWWRLRTMVECSWVPFGYTSRDGLRCCVSGAIPIYFFLQEWWRDSFHPRIILYRPTRGTILLLHLIGCIWTIVLVVPSNASCSYRPCGGIRYQWVCDKKLPSRSSWPEDSTMLVSTVGRHVCRQMQGFMKNST